LEENPNDARIIVQKVILQHKHVTQLKAREMVQRKTVMGGGGLPGKLSDCSEQDPANVGISCRGDSAGGTAAKVVIVIFNLPLRGKILNVEKAMHQVF
jgi:DNA gyrase subunit B